MNIRRHNRLAAACAAGLFAVPMAAQAALAEFSWTGREGTGRIVYDWDAVDSDTGALSASFANSIVSFDLWGSLWGSLGDTIHLQGTGGSYRSEWIEPDLPTCHTHGTPCNSARLEFDLGAAHAGSPINYTLGVSTIFALDNGRLPVPLPDLPDDYRYLSGGIYNDTDGRYYLAFDVRSQWDHRVLAAPVPEPATWALVGLGLALIGAQRRRQGR